MTSDAPAKLINEPTEYAIDSWADFRQAALQTIGLAGSTLVLFDSDLSLSGLESPEGVEHLTALLLRSGQPEAVRILLRDARHLEQNCPRLLGLLTRFGHRITVRVAGTHLAIPESAFLIADLTHLLIRFHHERPRGKHCIDDAHSASDCSAQFETLWINAETGPSTAPIGL